MPPAILPVPLYRILPPKESIKKFVENRGRQDGSEAPDKRGRHFLTRLVPAPSIKHRHSGGYPPNVTKFCLKIGKNRHHERWVLGEPCLEARVRG